MDVHKFGYKKCLNPLIETFAKLESEGLKIKVKGFEKTVYFCLTQITGDNKGLNEILMFTRSFIAKRHCRMCGEDKTIMQKACRENPSVIRTSNNYYRDLQISNEKETGIRGVCAFNNLKSFKAFNNFVVDIHHDLLEGDCHFVICNVLRYYIGENLLTLERLNKIRANFVAESFGRNISDIPIKAEHLQKEKLHLNASEMKQFALFLPLMLDHIIQDKNTDYWKILILIVEILEIVLLPAFDEEILEHLDKLITKHHKLFLKLFRYLRFKQHVMLHYTRAIRNVGPLCNISAMRGEAKHQSLKRIAESTASRRNLPKTIIICDGFEFAARSLKTNGFQNLPKIGKAKIVSEEVLDKIRLIDSDNILNLSNLKAIKYLNVHGIKFREGYALYEKDSYSVESLYKINHIITDYSKSFFIVEKLTNFTYKKNIRCFIKNETENCNQNVVEKIINVSDVQYEPSLFIKMPSGNVALKFYRKLEKI